MSRIDLGRRDPQKRSRFRRPEFQKKLQYARSFQRKAEPVLAGFWPRALKTLGLGSIFARSFSLAVVLALVYFFTLSPVFLVKKIDLQTEGLSQGQITSVLDRMQKHRVYFIPSNDIFIMSQKRFFDALKSDFPQIRRLTAFRRIFPDRIQLGVELRQPLYVWGTGQNFYFLDQDGVVFQQLADYNPTTYSQVLIADQAAEPVTVGEQMGIRPALDFIAGLKAVWSREITQTNFVSFVLPGVASPDLIMKTGIGFEVLFDLSRSTDHQVAALNLLLNREIKPETYTGLSYIDLRLPSTAYYCYKDAPCALQNATSTPAGQK